MEAINDNPACPATASSGSKLRYPLRSAGRLNEGRQTMADASSNSSASKRGRPLSCVSKSVDVLDLSAKEKSGKPPRRLSNPTKAGTSPRPAPFGSITPISETRLKRANTQGRSDTPLSETSSTGRRKFNVLTSVSYWLTQIKLAESASKHSISLGFFKLALESGCEPLQRMREELKSYARRHNLVAELEAPTKDLLQCYNIEEDFHKLKLSENSSQEGEQTSNEEAQRPSATSGAGNLKPRSLNIETFTVPQSDKKERSQKGLPAAKNKASNIKPVSASDGNGKNIRKKSQNPNPPSSNSGNAKIKSSTTDEKVDSVNPSPAEEAPCEDKENMDVVSTEEASTREEIEAR